MAQTPGGQALTSAIPAEAASLTWMQGVRVHTNADGSKVREAFLGPVNGVVTGTALSAIDFLLPNLRSELFSSSARKGLKRLGLATLSTALSFGKNSRSIERVLSRFS